MLKRVYKLLRVHKIQTHFFYSSVYQFWVHSSVFVCDDWWQHLICISWVNIGRQWQNEECDSLFWSCPDSWVSLPDQSIVPLKPKINIKSRMKKYLVRKIASDIKQPLIDFSVLFSFGWSVVKSCRGCCVKAFRSLLLFICILPPHSFVLFFHL